MIYWRPQFFKIEEIAPPELFEQHRDQQWKLWLMFDNRILLAADLLRRQFGSAVINDWAWGGGFKASGLRTPTSMNYSMTSQHSWGRALDMKFKNSDACEVRGKIIKEKGFGLITAIEDDVSWVHIDCRVPRKTGELLVFKP